MRRLYTVAYPELSSEKQQLIDAFRQKHDPHFTMVAAHFTMVFGVDGVEDNAYIEHIQEAAKLTPKLHFCCRYAMLGADDSDDTAYVFLVPDEGYSAISLLHDRLYAGLLEPFHRLDIPYVPHITLASSKSREEMKSLCAELNSSGLVVAGELSRLTVGALESGSFTTLAELPLSAP